MLKNKKELHLYISLSCLLCVIFVSSNLICRKFISLNIFNWLHFEVSAGVLFYPITFLLTDLITEFYGKSFARLAIKFCLLCGCAITLLIYIASKLDATPWSQVNNNLFNQVFSIYDISVAASCLSFYIAQIFDIHIFSYIKKSTKGKHLWLRNNLSSFISQLIDTILIVAILTFFSAIPNNKFLTVAISSYLFKMFAATLDTPFCYIAHFYIRRYLSQSNSVIGIRAN